MMLLDDLIKRLIKLQAEGAGLLPVFAIHGSSGAVDGIGGAHVQKARDGDIDMGLDLEEGEEFVEIYIGH
jgi:hypothetical protein